MPAKSFPFFEVRAKGTLQVGETLVPVTIIIDASCGQPAAVGRVYGPKDVLFDAYYNQRGVIKIGDVKIPACFRCFNAGECASAFFDTPPLLRALARHATQRLMWGV